jgi:putative membrane protein
VLALALDTPALHLIMQASLFGAALWFWRAILSGRSHGRWQAILALLFTAKLSCLPGVLLVFAPRALYAAPGTAGLETHLLADQQLAGLLMLAACPLTYLVAGVLIASRWLRDLGLAGRHGGTEPAG